MNEEEKIKLEINKLEKEKDNFISLFISMFAGVLGIGVTFLINNKNSSIQAIIAVVSFCVCLRLLQIFDHFNKNKRERLDKLYKKLGIPVNLEENKK